MKIDVCALAESVLTKYSLVTAFAVVGLVVWLSYWLSAKLTRGHVHGSAIAILLALIGAYFAGGATGGKQGLADITWLSGIGLMGGAMLRDFAIVATAFGVKLEQFTKTGLSGVISLLLGVFASFFLGAAVAWAFGYRDAVSLTTIGGGAATYIVGPVTGSALGASSEVLALSVAAGLVKAILVMCLTPFVAPLGAATLVVKNRANGKSQILPWAPFVCDLDGLADAQGLVDVEWVLTRRNTFGPLHLTPMDPVWVGPAQFRSEGDQWSDDYQLIPVGMAAPPSLLKA